MPKLQDVQDRARIQKDTRPWNVILNHRFDSLSCLRWAVPYGSYTIRYIKRLRIIFKNAGVPKKQDFHKVIQQKNACTKVGGKIRLSLSHTQNYCANNTSVKTQNIESYQLFRLVKWGRVCYTLPCHSAGNGCEWVLFSPFCRADCGLNTIGLLWHFFIKSGTFGKLPSNTNSKPWNGNIVKENCGRSFRGGGSTAI